MLFKKFFLLAGLSLLTSQMMTAQETQPQTTPAATGSAATPGTPQWSSRDMTYRGKNYDVLDSSYYTKKQQKQFRAYINHQDAFPPKPRNQYEIGFGFGLYNLNGDVPSLMLWQKGGGAIHLHVRKAWGYVFSTRLQYIYGVAKNLDVQPTESYGAPYINHGYTPIYNATLARPANEVYRATRMESSQLNLDLIFNVHNINFHQARNVLSFYGYLGLGGLGYKTRVNALDGTQTGYDYSKIVTNKSASNSTVRKDLQSKMDKTYETAADNGNASTILDKKTLDFAPSIGLGVQYRINKTWNIQIEDRVTMPNDDYLDGTKFGAMIGNSASVSQDKDALNYFSVGLNYNLKVNKKKSVEPLYWINPLDHAYNELSYPRHMLLPSPVLPDEDNDGITDQFDKCPKTPAGVAVDPHGCPMDTDGDGVPDYKDKQLITPTECQPVDADGVGHCPCPEACKLIISRGDSGNGYNPDCPNIKDGAIHFKGNNSTITPDMQKQLSTVASQMKIDATCKLVVRSGGPDKHKEQKAWERVNAVIEYMTEKCGILRDRFIFQYDKGDDESTVNYHAASTDETGPSSVAPPHPELR